jgi:hypothetical protein
MLLVLGHACASRWLAVGAMAAMGSRLETLVGVFAFHLDEKRRNSPSDIISIIVIINKDEQRCGSMIFWADNIIAIRP